MIRLSSKYSELLNLRELTKSGTTYFLFQGDDLKLIKKETAGSSDSIYSRYLDLLNGLVVSKSFYNKVGIPHLKFISNGKSSIEIGLVKELIDGILEREILSNPFKTFFFKIRAFLSLRDPFIHYFWIVNQMKIFVKGYLAGEKDCDKIVKQLKEFIVIGTGLDGDTTETIIQLNYKTIFGLSFYSKKGKISKRELKNRIEKQLKEL